METAFCVVVTIVLSVAFAGLLASHPTQMPGSPHGNFVGKITGPAESPGLSASPGLRQREMK